MQSAISIAISTMILLAGADLAHAAPQITWHTPSVRPGQTVLAYGGGFSAKTQCAVLALDDVSREAIPETFAERGPLPPEPPKNAKVLDAAFVSPRRAGWVVPGGRENDRLYLLWFGEPGDWSRTLVVNRPVIKHVEPAFVEPGGKLSFFGQNLGGTPTYNSEKRRTDQHAWVLLGNGRDRIVAQIPGLAQSQYELTIDLPKDLAPGEYRVCVHGLRGDQHGWSASQTVTVNAPRPWPEATFDARERGISGDGVDDQTATLKTLMAECAAAGGGTVVLPAGTVTIRETLEIPPTVWLRGVGMDSTILAFDPSVPFVKGQRNPMLRARRDCRLTDMTVATGPATVRGLLIQGEEAPAEDVIIRRCRFQALRDEDVAWNQGVLFNAPWSQPPQPIIHCEISDCEIEAHYSLFISSARNCRILRNKLVHTHMPLASWSMKHCLVEGNWFVPARGDRSAHGPMLMCEPGFYGGVVGNVYRLNYGGHHGPRLTGPRNVGEAFAFDCLANIRKAVHVGNPSNADASSITFPEVQWEPGHLAEMTVFVVGGKGVGQVRVVADNTANRVTLNEPWAIVPDGSSVVCVNRTFRDNMVIRNEFTDAGSCFIWGRGFHNLFALNQLEDVGFLGAVGLGWQTHDRPNPCFFNEFTDNWVTYRTRKGSGIGDRSANYGDPKDVAPAGPLCLGTVVRGNHIRGADKALTVGNQRCDKERLQGAWVWDTLFEKNELHDCKVGVELSLRASGAMVRANEMEQVDEAVVDDGENTTVVQ